MSADRWSICPQCEARRVAAYKAEREKVVASYGQIPATEYEERLLDLDKSIGSKPPETYSEYWEITLTGEAVLIDYSGECRECGLKKVIRHLSPLDVSVPFPRCPACGHQPHGEICLNMASDNDCSCSYVATDEVS
jgi:hypothetical protein